MLGNQNIRMLFTQATFLPNKFQRVKVETHTHPNSVGYSAWQQDYSRW